MPPADQPRASADATALLLQACARRNRSRPPVWIMRQAGRYLPEYQEVRKRHAFQEMCTRPELAVEVSLQPLRRFGFDAAIVFYDILFLVEAMGAPLEFTEEGPRFRRAIAAAADVRALRAPDVRESRPGLGTGAVLESLRELRRQAPPETAVIGFAGAPFTLAAYLAEGGARRPGERLRRLIHEDAGTARLLLERLTEATVEYVAAQAEAGAEAVQLFDTWAGVLAAAEYREFALPYQQAVFARLAAAGLPSILYVNGSAHLLDEMRESRAAVLSLDWRHSLAAARGRLGAATALQGNLDPAALFASPDAVRRRTGALLESMRGEEGYDPGYIVNLGHGITPETPLASVEAFVETVKGFRP